MEKFWIVEFTHEFGKAERQPDGSFEIFSNQGLKVNGTGGTSITHMLSMPSWKITGVISDGIRFNIGDMVRMKNSRFPYHRITGFGMSTKFNRLLTVVDNYESPLYLHTLEKENK